MKYLSLIICLILIPVCLMAQPGPPPPDPGEPVPLSGIELLLAAGALFGGKKLWDRTKRISR